MARSLIAYHAVEEIGHAIADVARVLGMTQASVFYSVKKGKSLSDEMQII